MGGTASAVAKTSYPTNQNQDLPSWAERLLKRPLVEVRRGLSLDYDPPFEDSSVVVLTTPSGKYVDVRFRFSPDHKSPVNKDSDKFAGYATAGLSTATLPPGSVSCVSYECTVHVEWEHPIDSSASFTTDSADIYFLANGDTMEVGTMIIDGKTRMFKEYWIEPTCVDTSKYVVVETSVTEGTVVGKGMAIMVGNYCQGILQTKHEFWVERWEIRDGKWIRDVQSNTPSDREILPCQWIVKQSWMLADNVLIGDKEWKVTESSNNH